MSLLLLLYGPGTAPIPQPDDPIDTQQGSFIGQPAGGGMPQRKRLPPYVFLPNFVELEDEEFVILDL